MLDEAKGGIDVHLGKGNDYESRSDLSVFEEDDGNVLDKREHPEELDNYLIGLDHNEGDGAQA